MCTVKGGKNGSNTFGEGWGTFPPTSNQPKGRISRDLGGGAAGGDDLLLLLSGRSEGKKGRVGERRPARAQDIGPVAPARMARQACRASACGATGRATSSPTRRNAGSGRQRGHTIAPHALARQRLSVAPEPVSRPNGLRPTNKKQYGLNLKCY